MSGNKSVALSVQRCPSEKSNEQHLLIRLTCGQHVGSSTGTF